MCAFPRTHVGIPRVRSNTHVSALSSGRLAASSLSPLSLSLCLPCSLSLSSSLGRFASFSLSLSLSLLLCHAPLPCSRKPRIYGPRNRTPNIEPLSPTSPNAFRECGPVRYPSRCLPACLPAGLHFRETPRTHPTNQVGNRKFASRRQAEINDSVVALIFANG